MAKRCGGKGAGAQDGDCIEMFIIIIIITVWLRFDRHSTTIRLRNDHLTTYITTVGLPVVGCCTAA